MIKFELTGPERVDEVRALWLELHHHHRRVSTLQPLVDDDTFPVGPLYAELYSLSVARRMRGNGVGTRLLDFVERELSARGIDDLKVAVMVGNTDAQRFYERRGLRPAETVLYRLGKPSGA